MVVRMTKKLERTLVCKVDPIALREMYEETGRERYKAAIRHLAPLRKSAMIRLMHRIRVDEQGNWIDKQRNAKWGETGPKMRDRQMSFLGAPEYVHRVAWTLFVGEIPPKHSLMREEGREWSVCPSHMSCLMHGEVMSELAERRLRAGERADEERGING